MAGKKEDKDNKENNDNNSNFALNPTHDKYFKRSLSDPKVAKDFLAMHLDKEVQALVDLDTIELQKESFVDLRHEVAK